MEDQRQRKPRFLCLHGYGNSAENFKQLVFTKWPQSVTQKLDLVFLDGPFPSQGSSSDVKIYEWFHSSEDFTEHTNFEEGLAYIEDYMVNNGPFEGIMGFSQDCKSLLMKVKKIPEKRKLNLAYRIVNTFNQVFLPPPNSTGKIRLLVFHALQLSSSCM